MRILIAEDNLSERMVLERTISKLGYEYDSVADGVQFLAKYQAKAYPIIILDWMMPGMNGIELCASIRKTEAEANRYSYIIMVTAKAKKEHMIQAFNSGVDDFLIKPFDPHVLTTRLRVAERIINMNKVLAEKNEKLTFLQNELIMHNVGLRGQLENLKETLKKKEAPKNVKPGPYTGQLEPGEIHLIECRSGAENKAYNLFKEDIGHGLPGFVLSRSPPNKVKQAYQLENIEVIWLSKSFISGEKQNLPLNFLALDSERTETTAKTNLTAIIELVKEFIDLNIKAVILLDGVEYLFTRFATRPTMDMLYELSELIKTTDGKMIITCYPETLDSNIVSLLKREMNWIPIEE